MYIRKRGNNSKTISAVYTFNQYRGRGYAKMMINFVCESALKDCRFISLFVDKNNLISNKVYIDNGFVPITDMYDYKIIKK